MYWQLHLAYDMGGYNFKTFDTSKEQLENLIFARMDSYVRKPSSAPGAEGNKLKLSGTDKDNVLMRLAAAAARKDLLDFFRHWGMEPDADTCLLYTSYHVSLRSDEDRETMGKRIQSLKDRLDQPDPVSGELHPRKEILETELANAERILKDGALQAEIQAVDSKDTGNSDGHITFKGGLNTYQPLGVTAKAGETVTVYVGSPAHKTGDGTRLRLIQTCLLYTSRCV